MTRALSAGNVLIQPFVEEPMRRTSCSQCLRCLIHPVCSAAHLRGPGADSDRPRGNSPRRCCSNRHFPPGALMAVGCGLPRAMPHEPRLLTTLRPFTAMSFISRPKLLPRKPVNQEITSRTSPSLPEISPREKLRIKTAALFPASIHGRVLLFGVDQLPSTIGNAAQGACGDFASRRSRSSLAQSLGTILLRPSTTSSNL